MTLPDSYEVRDGCGNCYLASCGDSMNLYCTNGIPEAASLGWKDWWPTHRVEFNGHCEYHEREKE